MSKDIIDFYKVYNEYFTDKILPEIFPYENKRKKNLYKITLVSSMFLLIGVLISFGFFYMFEHGIYNTVLWTIVLLLIYTFLFRSMIYHLEISSDFESELSENLLKYFLTPIANFKPWPLNHNTESIIDSKIFPNFSIHQDSKGFFGYYNKTNIMITDTSLASITALDKKNLFKGAIIQLEFEKNIADHLIIQPKWLGKIAGYNLINLENNCFSEFAAVYSKDKTTDISFIDEDFITLLESFGKAFQAMTLRVSIKDNIIVISLPSKKKVFHIAGMFKPLTELNTYNDLLDKFVSIFNLINKLNKKD